MTIESAIMNSTKEIILNTANHVIRTLPNDTINIMFQTDRNDSLHLFFEGLTAVGTVTVPIIIAFLTKTYSQKQNEQNGMRFVFDTINSTPHKSAEENIYDAYRSNILMRNNQLNPDHLNPANVVRRNYDQIGMMMQNKLIPRIQYYQMFGVITTVSYFVLKQSIENERLDHRFFMAYFTNLAIDCFEFWDEQYDKPNITDPNLKTITRDMLGKKINIPKKRRFPF